MESDILHGRDLWVFGYGSLMWHPGFAYLEQRDALLTGFHRSFCLYSYHYRGTRENPGLVLGLAQGGVCHGSAFRVAPDNAHDVVSYLNERELVAYAYLPRYLDVALKSGDQEAETVRSYTFIADSSSDQYAENLSMQQKAELIMMAQGIAGLNRDYLINTVRHMEDSGVADGDLVQLMHEIEHRTGIIDMGGGI